MKSIANSNNIVQKRAIWDAKIGVEVGEHIIKGRITKEEVRGEACSYVDSRAEG